MILYLILSMYLEFIFVYNDNLSILCSYAWLITVHAIKENILYFIEWILWYISVRFFCFFFPDLYLCIYSSFHSQWFPKHFVKKNFEHIAKLTWMLIT